jgi:hypothetical protein
VEPKKESRGDMSAYRSIDRALPTHRTNISEFMRLEEKLSIYAVTILPQDMAWDVPVPPAVLCGGRRQRIDKHTGQLTAHPYANSNFPWMTHMLENNLWLGSGRTRSQLHFDKENIVNCLFQVGLGRIVVSEKNATETVSNPGISWLSSTANSAKRQCDQILLPGPQALGDD